MKKKLFIVTTVPDTFEYILSSQPGFLNQHFHVIVVSSNPERIAKFARSEGVDFATVEMARGIAPLQDLKSIWNMVLLLLRLRPDVVHSYTPKAGMVCAIAGFIARVPVRIHTFTGLIFPACGGFKQRLLQTIDWFVCKLNTNIVPEGQGVLSDLTPICQKPLKVIGNGNIAGIDLGYFDWRNQQVQTAAAELRQQYQLQDKKVFCFIGRLNADKGLQELCQAFAALDQTQTALLIVGGLDDEKPITEATLQQIRQVPGIIWLGFQADVRPALSAADVFVLPSYREGFPNVLLQACAMAKPSLVTNVSGSNEVVQQDVNGWIVPVKDSGALHIQMAGILQISNAELRQKGQNALHLVTERFERRSYQQHLLQFYQDILR
ncbi:glycosyltransferase family 1 protein [Rheinheimera riviphila]|uniref:Glycosyltransferase family 1 protein n=1 Tax=Rheinheimera riviphila TaxID=1834037 RepID=A0A437R3D6_9GAMM|nr:glycosyltransferase family 4 protein [Rheinheimera riviphila]RVU41288.1 glycosyltransferase family 1 protein [Rheinheimera riviphila]